MAEKYHRQYDEYKRLAGDVSQGNLSQELLADAITYQALKRIDERKGERTGPLAGLVAETVHGITEREFIENQIGWLDRKKVAAQAEKDTIEAIKKEAK